jgi:cytochrome P450/NADPH-cytochrome P450 reductase
VDRKYADDIKFLQVTAEDVLKSRKEQPSKRKDLLNAMLNGQDPKTGQKMTDESIIDNLITFLIAGHDRFDENVHLFYARSFFVFFPCLILN